MLWSLFASRSLLGVEEGRHNGNQGKQEPPPFFEIWLAAQIDLGVVQLSGRRWITTSPRAYLGDLGLRPVDDGHDTYRLTQPTE